MKKIAIKTALATLTLLAYFSGALACTSFRLTAKDGTVLITRSQEFSLDFKTEIRTSGRDRTFTTTAPDGKPGLTWKSKYGYLFFGLLGVDAASDGLNEAGLSFEALYLPGYAQYQTVPDNHDSQALPYIYMGDWILGNFKTVDEVRNALPHILLFTTKVPGLGDTVFPLHFSIYDASGKGIVVEYIGGKLHIHDNKIGVMTNSPSYDWHITNLNNYTQLKPTNPNPVVEDKITFVATGQGAGMVGLPGDVSPPSRFVKMAVLLDVVTPAPDAKSALNLAEHIINNVDIPAGLVREPSNGNYTSETTQWVTFKDLTHKVMYYRTYNDLSLHAVSMSRLDFSQNAARLRMPISSPEYINDITSEFLLKKGN